MLNEDGSFARVSHWCAWPVWPKNSKHLRCRGVRRPRRFEMTQYELLLCECECHARLGVKPSVGNPAREGLGRGEQGG